MTQSRPPAGMTNRWGSRNNVYGSLSFIRSQRFSTEEEETEKGSPASLLTLSKKTVRKTFFTIDCLLVD